MCRVPPHGYSGVVALFLCEKHTASDPFLFRPLAAKLFIKLLRRQSFPALKPSAGQHVPSVSGLHALTEAVYLFPLPFLRLVGL